MACPSDGGMGCPRVSLPPTFDIPVEILSARSRGGDCKELDMRDGIGQTNLVFTFLPNFHLLFLFSLRFRFRFAFIFAFVFV